MSIGNSNNLIGGILPHFKSGLNNNLTDRVKVFVAALAGVGYFCTATEKTALNNFDLSLISLGLLPAGTGAGIIKDAIVCIGSTSNTFKFNFVNPVDSNAAFRINFFGGYIFSSNGVKPNGINTYANTYLNRSTDLSQNNIHVAKYIRENIRTGFGIDISDLIGDGSFYLSTYTAGAPDLICNINSSPLGLLQVVNPTANGFYVAQRANSMNRLVYKNGVLLNTYTNASTIPLNTEIILDAFGNINYTTREWCYFSAGQALTAIQNSGYYTAVQTLQTALSRQV
jgi:hypothetical protein